jgi:hypothetical protein
VAWERSRHKQTETKSASALALLDDDTDAAKPTLCHLALAAQRVWIFCGGYQPALWPSADAFEGPFPDWQALAGLLRVLQSELRNG